MCIRSTVKHSREEPIPIHLWYVFSQPPRQSLVGFKPLYTRRSTIHLQSQKMWKEKISVRRNLTYNFFRQSSTTLYT